MERRRFLLGLAGAALLGTTGAAWRLWPEQGLANPCRAALPPSLSGHPLMARIWQGLDPAKVWDAHVHIAGVGDGGTGVWASPQMDSLLNPMQYAQKLFFMNAGCAHDAPGRVDAAYVARMANLMDAFPAGARLLLFAFDWAHTDDGRADPDNSTFHVPDAYAARLAREYPERFAWAASIHPWRADALTALDQAAANGARAVKWLPAAMGIDPAAPRCDAFYAALVRHDLPLITHAGREQAVHGPARQDYGNPLKLRRALDAGVRVVVAHCASDGEDRDLDRAQNQGEGGPLLRSFDLFARLMEEARYEGRLFADISAVTQRNRAWVLQEILKRRHWHGRLLNGSDYPLPGIMPLFSVAALIEDALLPAESGDFLRELRTYNPLLFDFAVKRLLVLDGKGLPASVFETRDFFTPRPGVAARSAA